MKKHILTCCITVLFFTTSLASATVSYTVTDSLQGGSIIFYNGLTSDSVYNSPLNTGEFTVEDVQECPTLVIRLSSNMYYPVSISLDKPLIEFTITVVNNLPQLQFANDTFNQAYFERAKTLWSLTEQQRNMAKAFRDTTLNSDSLSIVWKQLRATRDSVDFSFYYHHGHNANTRLFYAYFALKGRYLSADSVQLILNGLSDRLKQFYVYRYCINLLNDTTYPVTVGEHMPPLTMKDTAGRQVAFMPLGSNKTQYYFFWATWCNGCKPELKQLSALTAALDSLQIGLAVVNTDRDMQRWKQYVAKDSFLHSTYYYSYLDTDEWLLRLGVNYLPYIIEVKNGIVNRKGLRVEDIQAALAKEGQ